MKIFCITLVLAGLVVYNPASGFCAQNHGQQKTVNREVPPPKPVDILLKAARLDDSAIGYAAQRTAVYDAFSQLYKANASSLNDAKHLVEAGSPAGKIYGYLILRHISQADAEAAAGQLARNNSILLVLNGCIGSHHTVSDLVARVRKGGTVIFLPQ